MLLQVKTWYQRRNSFMIFLWLYPFHIHFPLSLLLCTDPPSLYMCSPPRYFTRVWPRSRNTRNVFSFYYKNEKNKRQFALLSSQISWKRHGGTIPPRHCIIIDLDLILTSYYPFVLPHYLLCTYTKWNRITIQMLSNKLWLVPDQRRHLGWQNEIHRQSNDLGIWVWA